MVVIASRKVVESYTLYQLMVYFFGFMYIAWPLSHALLIHSIPVVSFIINDYQFILFYFIFNSNLSI